MKIFSRKLIAFLSSTKIAIILITLITILSISGTFLTSYPIFNSWWYLSLLLLLVLSLFTCSFKRFTFLFRLKTYSYSPNLKLNIYEEYTISADTSSLIYGKELLNKRGYTINDLGNKLIAEKNAFSRWGAFIIHIGIIVMALGILSRIIPGWYMNDFIWLRTGEEYTIPGTTFSLKNTHFIVENYTNGTPKKYQTNLQVTNPETGLLMEDSVQVNHPLEIENFSVFQTDYKQVFSELWITIKDKQQNILGNISIDLYNPKKEINLSESYVLLIKEYFPDLALDNSQHPVSKSSFPNNPAFVFQIRNILDNRLSKEQWFILRNFTDPSLGQESNYEMELNQFKYDYISGLMLHKDIGRLLVFIGLFFTVIGLFIALYFQHKKLWITFTSSKIYLEARTNRNIEGLKLEIRDMMNQIIARELNKNEQLASTIL